MMKKVIFMLAFVLAVGVASAQESNGNKQLWAKSYLNQKAPELVVEKYLSDEPQLEGKFILIDFWATWCGPCRKAIPELNELQKKFADDLVVIGISDETEEKILAMESPVIEFTSAQDTQARLKKLYEVKGIPHSVLISPKGIVIWEGYPLYEGYELSEEVVAKLIEKYK
ncbi:MAG: TlpA disulfide reductase family protein [Rikenellaceae bacterium]